MASSGRLFILFCSSSLQLVTQYNTRLVPRHCYINRKLPRRLPTDLFSPLSSALTCFLLSVTRACHVSIVASRFQTLSCEYKCGRGGDDGEPSSTSQCLCPFSVSSTA